MDAEPATPVKLNSSAIFSSIMRRVQQLHGDFGTAAIKSGLTVKYCNENTRVVLIRCRHGPHKLVASSLPVVNRIDSRSVRMDILYTGATIRQCFKFILEYQQRKFDEFCRNLKNDKDREELREAFLNIDSIADMM